MSPIRRGKLGQHRRHVGMKEFEKYIFITLRHVDTVNLAALYLESFLNDYSNDYAQILANEVAERKGGFDTTIQVSVRLFQEGYVGPSIPLELKVIQNLMQRGDARESLRALIENNNLKNAVKIIAAGCEWLPAEKIDDELLDKVVKHVTLLAN